MIIIIICNAQTIATCEWRSWWKGFKFWKNSNLPCCHLLTQISTCTYNNLFMKRRKKSSFFFCWNESLRELPNGNNFQSYAIKRKTFQHSRIENFRKKNFFSKKIFIIKRKKIIMFHLSAIGRFIPFKYFKTSFNDQKSIAKICYVLIVWSFTSKSRSTSESERLKNVLC